MIAIVLAAGYATRLYPLTRDFPKPLLEVGGKTILDHLVDQIETIPGIDSLVLVTNHRFVGQFRKWAHERDVDSFPITVLDDSTRSNEDRLGAVGDLRFALESQNISDDVLVLAADNILRFPLSKFVDQYSRNPHPHICVRRNPDSEDQKRRGNAVLDAENRVVRFVEKPDPAISDWTVPPFYIYPESVLSWVREYLDKGGNPDAPGHLIEWLHTREPVFAHRIQGQILDIGNHESLAEARRALGETTEL